MSTDAHATATMALMLFALELHRARTALEAQAAALAERQASLEARLDALAEVLRDD